MIRMELKKAFETALAMEQKGHQIYLKTAHSTENPIVQKTFSYLAEQEAYHIEEIKEYIAKLNDGHKIELRGDTLDDTKKFFTTTIEKFKEKTKLSDTDIKAHETALELEQNAYDFYKKERDETDDEEIKKFFGWLMRQENAHYEFIQKSYEYLKDPVHFYSEEEGWIVDGG
jgi:rubrerythrin